MPDPSSGRRAPAAAHAQSPSSADDANRNAPETAADTGTTAGAPNPAIGGGSDTTPSSGVQQQNANEPVDESKLSDEEREQNVAFRDRYARSVGRGLSDLESERIELLGPNALGTRVVRSQSVALTSMGPVDYHDATMTDKDLWKRQEKVYIQTNQREVERAAQFCEEQGIEGLTTVKSGLVGDNANRVAFTEYNDAHPHSFAYVAGQDSPPSIVALTPEVQRALLQSQIIEVESELPESIKAHVKQVKPRNNRGRR
jgi:hypothetical protein